MNGGSKLFRKKDRSPGLFNIHFSGELTISLIRNLLCSGYARAARRGNDTKNRAQ